jgi:hypothetical protein
MRALAFFIILLCVLYGLWMASRPQEGFQTVVVPTPQPPVIALLGSGGPVPVEPPTTDLLTPPPGQTASVNSFAYEDPSLEKAPLQRIQVVLESLKAFFQYDAPGLSALSDPVIVLPLGTAKSDLQRINDEIAVMSKNPGLPSTLTQKDLDGIEANLLYLQRKWRLSLNNKPYVVEGFQANVGSGPQTSFGPSDPTQGIGSPYTATNGLEASAAQAEVNATGPSSPDKDDKTPATVQQIQQTLGSIQNEILNLQASGTTDPITQSRVTNLTIVSKMLNDILTRVNQGAIPASSIPVYNRDLQNFLPVIGDTSKELPPIPGLGSKGTAHSSHSAPSMPPAPDTAYRGNFQNTVQNVDGGQGTLVPGYAPPAGALDWKPRAEKICSALEKRGYEPRDFGCLKPEDTVGANFSWRGYARMVCTRIGTIYDSGVPEMCGCPPPTWPGWRT